MLFRSRMWPDVAKFLARAVKFIRGVIWKITDVSEKIKEQIERESPIDDLIKTTTDDILAEISEPIKKIKKRTVKKSGGKKK